MISSKTKTGLSETVPNKSRPATPTPATPNKSRPATPRVSKLTKGPSKSDSSSPSSLLNLRHSIDLSPRSVDSKPTVDRRSPINSTPPEKRVLKGSKLQDHLVFVQEDLKKLKECLASTEKEKTHVLEELEKAKRVADETNEKINEALLAQKRAEEVSEIEKFRADELEQADIDATQKREEERYKELESVRSQHAVDVAALLSVNQEIQNVKHELSLTSDAKSTALSQAEEAMKIAEINAEKVEHLSNELSRLKALLDLRLEAKSNEIEIVKKLNSEVGSLKQELERSKAEEKVGRIEGIIEKLRVELKDAKKAKLDLCNLVDEWRKRAELLEIQLEEASQSEKLASGSLVVGTKQLEGNLALLQQRELEVACLRGVVESLGISIVRRNEGLEESSKLLQMTKQETLKMARTAESLRSELESIEEEKLRALNNKMVAATTIQGLLEEKKDLKCELEVSRDEEEKRKKAMESLASAYQAVSEEARNEKDNLLTTQGVLLDAKSQIEDLKLVLNSTKEKYEGLTDEMKYEIGCLKKSVERSNLEVKNPKAEMDEKELSFVASLKKSEEENDALIRAMNKLANDSKREWEEKELCFVSTIRELEEEISTAKRELDRVITLIGATQEESRVAKEEKARLLNTLNRAESEAGSAKKVAEKALAEGLKLKESLLEKENDIQSIARENKELQIKETSTLKKFEQMKKSLDEAAIKSTEENGNLSNSEKECDLLPKTVGLEEKNVDVEMEKSKTEFSFPYLEEHNGEDVLDTVGSMGPKLYGGGKVDEEDSQKNEAKTWDNCGVNEKDLSLERELGQEQESESLEGEVNSKVGSKNLDHTNGLLSDIIENGGTSLTNQPKKKKKPLLHKFGNLLKKKSNTK